MRATVRPQLNSLVGAVLRHGVQSKLRERTLEERFYFVRTYVKEDPTATYDLHAAFSKDPNTVKVEDALDEYTKIQQAAIRAGKRPPKKKRPQFDAVGTQIGIRYINHDVPFRVRERLVAEGMEMKPQFFIGRFGLNKEVVKSIRSAFRHFEIVRIELGSPWTDNTNKFAERLELRTGAIVLDRAGSRVLLYRGFTHADLARKGMLDPSCFTVGHEYSIRKKREKENKTRFDSSRQGEQNGHEVWGTQQRSTTGSESMRYQHSRRELSPVDETQSRRPARNEGHFNSKSFQEEEEAPVIFSDESAAWEDEEEDQGMVELKQSFAKKPKSEVIDLDDGDGESIVKGSEEEPDSAEVANLLDLIQYNAARVKESKPYNAAMRQQEDHHQKRIDQFRSPRRTHRKQS